MPGRRSRWWLLATALVVIGAVVAVLVVRNGDSATSHESTAPRYVDEAVAAGIVHRYEGDFSYFVGGGVATFDCDDDGYPDVYLAGGSAPAALYRNASARGGALRFAQVRSPATDLTAVTGAYPLDVDSDGVMDLAVLRNAAGNVLLRGLGDCRFEAANDRFGLDGGTAWTVGFSATWEGSNALPTLAFGNYLEPGTSDCAESALVRPKPSGGTYDDPIPLAPGYCTLSVLFSDWSRSGRRDLRMANDRHYYIDGTEQLWRVEPDQPPRLYTAADGWRPLQIWGMGIASQDLTGDGYPEVFITSQADNKLQTLDAPGTEPAYHDIALRMGATATRPFTGGDVLPSTAWHPQFADVNNDGLIDLFVSKGNVEAQPDFAMRDPSDLLIGQSNRTFEEGAEAAGIVNYDRARGAAVVDLNLDGLLDLVVVNREADIKLWRNVGGSDDPDRPSTLGHWLAVSLRQPAPNVDAIGAWLDVRTGDRTIVSEITVGGGLASGQAGWLHTGLGDAGSAEVRVHWPDGTAGPWMTVSADQFVTIDRGSTGPVPWIPPDEGDGG